MSIIVNNTEVKSLVVNDTTCKTGIANGQTVFKSFDGIIFANGQYNEEIGAFVRRTAYGDFNITDNAIYTANWAANGVARKNLYSSPVPIDLTDWNTCTIEVKSSGFGCNGGICPSTLWAFSTQSNSAAVYESDDIGGGLDRSYLAAYCGQTWGTSTGTLTMDISGLSGSYYFHHFIRQYGGDSTGKTWTYSIILS